MDGKERFKKMSAVTTINLLDLVDAIGEDETKNLLSDFSCSKNQEIEKLRPQERLGLRQAENLHDPPGDRRPGQVGRHVCFDPQSH